MKAVTERESIPIQSRVTCPHCWSRFAAHEALYIAEHPDLRGDPRLGQDHHFRFLPTRFTVAGAAVDARNFPCHKLACPKCHLPMPRAMFQMAPIFFSILGAPSCGKSYFLASMTWMLRKTLPRHFGLAFGDADPELNHQLNEYEELQFLNPDQDRLVAIRKTEEQGDLYDTIRYSDQTIRYPRPFVFTLKPLEGHPTYDPAGKTSRALCLYDNAGESFLPGADSGMAPVTRHLAHSRCLFFLFDPTQDLRFRKACLGKTADPQMQDRAARLVRERAVRQDQILLEAAERTRRFANLGPGTQNSRPLVIVVTKYDAWSGLFDNVPLKAPWTQSRKSEMCAIDLDTIERRSQRLRNLLREFTPELVSAAESFTRELLFVPVSAMGRSPEVDPETGALGIRPRDINPQGAETPLLYALSKWVPGLIPYCKPNNPSP